MPQRHVRKGSVGGMMAAAGDRIASPGRHPFAPCLVRCWGRLTGGRGGWTNGGGPEKTATITLAVGAWQAAEENRALWVGRGTAEALNLQVIVRLERIGGRGGPEPEGEK